jgi:hypothetical protein
MFNDKFLTLRSLLPGDSGRGWEGENIGGCELPVAPSLCFDASIILWNGDRGKSDVGDSGDELGEGSVIDGDPNVDTVVVGEESVESELTDAVLPRC